MLEMNYIIALLVLVAAMPAKSYMLQPTKCVSPFIRLSSVTGCTNSIQSIRSSAPLMMAESDEKPTDDIDETTKKYGLEAGLFKAVTAKPEDGKKVKPQDLLKKYGVAYLATSITLAIISYAICYILVSNGIDVASLLEKVGIQSSSAAANTGTAAIAYAIHKAASPIRFPPTVLMTPVVAEWLGKKPVEEEKAN